MVMWARFGTVVAMGRNYGPPDMPAIGMILVSFTVFKQEKTGLEGIVLEI